MGEAEEHQGPVALQFARHQLRAIGLLEDETGKFAWLLEQLHRLQGGSRGARRLAEPGLGGPQPQAGGKRGDQDDEGGTVERSEEHTSELQSLMRISYAVFCLK